MNRPTIEPTVFIDARSDTKTFGVRVYDDTEQNYDNTWESIPEDDMEILKRVKDAGNSVFDSILDFVRENEGGLYIGDEWYDWKALEPILGG